MWTPPPLDPSLFLTRPPQAYALLSVTALLGVHAAACARAAAAALVPACALSAPGPRPPHVPLPPPAVLATARAMARAQNAARAAGASEAAVCALDWQPLLLLDLGQRGDTRQQQQQQDGRQVGRAPAGGQLQHPQPQLPHTPGSHHHHQEQQVPRPRQGGRTGGGLAGAWEGHTSPGLAAGGGVATRWFVLHWWPHEDGDGEAEKGPAASQDCGRLEPLGAFCARFAPRPGRKLRAGQEAGGSEGGGTGECEGGGGACPGGWTAAAEAAAREALEAVTGLMVIAVGSGAGKVLLEEGSSCGRRCGAGMLNGSVGLRRQRIGTLLPMGVL